jgi:hypothetical protein
VADWALIEDFGSSAGSAPTAGQNPDHHPSYVLAACMASGT